MLEQVWLFDFWNVFIRDLKPKLNKVNRAISSAQSCLLNIPNFFCLFFCLYYFHFLIPLFNCSYVNCKYLLFTFYSIVSEIVYMQNFLSMNLNMKMTVERSERRSHFLIACFHNTDVLLRASYFLNCSSASIFFLSTLQRVELMFRWSRIFLNFQLTNYSVLLAAMVGPDRFPSPFSSNFRLQILWTLPCS